MDDVKTALDKAAASPDPAVRSMALQYIEARNKLASLEAFFAFYAEGVSGLNGKTAHTVKPAAAPQAAARTAKPANKAPLPVKNAKAEAFTQTILAILRQSSAPIKLPDLQIAYESLKLEEPLQPETFRQRMILRQKRGEVVLIPRVGFWPPDPAAKAGADV